MVPTISILMPVYKTAPYLQEAVDSILAQSFTDFELIVLDDCSPDNAGEILDRYDDPRIVRYRGAKNQGLSNVLNIGLDMAKGKYIARMDSDDISLPERLQTQVEYLESHPNIDLCSCGMKLFGAKEGVWVRSRNPKEVKIDAIFYSPVLHASSIWRRDNFEKNGLRFRQDMVPAEDYDLWTRALLAGLSLVNLPQVLYKYRIHPNQATTQTDKTRAKEREIQQMYLQAACPSLSETDRASFPERVWPVLVANLKTGFFDRLLLARRLYKISKSTR